MVRIIDLSATLTPKQAQIKYVTHDESGKERAAFHGFKPDDLDIRQGRYCAMEIVTAGTHDTTHLDAPWHYGPTSEGKPAKTIDQVPLEWCYGDGVVLDFTHKKAGEGILAKEVEAALKKIDYKLKPWDIVLIRTDCYKRCNEPDYVSIHPGMTRESTLWLVERGIKVMGIDAWGWDRPHKVMIADMRAGNKACFWESHYAGMEREYLHMERLANLDKLPKPFDFKVAAFPIKIASASAGWVRAVAILD